ncbi:MAG: hypothetical protein QOG00_352, partial [Pyrinomonadaceae bacterium]|nr:hypothetical protein [Pyrinomonadaceae bacterium]
MEDTLETVLLRLDIATVQKVSQ